MPDEVGGETDIIIGMKYLKYFPKEVYKLPDGLTIYEAMFKSSDGSKGVVAGPHSSFSNDWETWAELLTPLRSCQRLLSTNIYIK